MFNIFLIHNDTHTHTHTHYTLHTHTHIYIYIYKRLDPRNMLVNYFIYIISYLFYTDNLYR